MFSYYQIHYCYFMGQYYKILVQKDIFPVLTAMVRGLNPDNPQDVIKTYSATFYHLDLYFDYILCIKYTFSFVNTNSAYF